jgi:hypothetical protein
MKSMKLRLFVLTGLAAAGIASADVLEMKNGQALSGRYAGGSPGVVQFETAAGMQTINTATIVSLTFTTPPSPPPPPPAPVSMGGSVTIPAGTMLLVRMADGASSNDARGKRFTTTLETDLAVNGVVLAKAGSKVYGRVENAQRAGRVAGKSVLDLRLSDLNVGGQLVPILTGPYVLQGENSMKKTAGGAAMGAAIGGIAGDAGKGAAIGATASTMKRGQAIVVKPGTLLEFTLQQPLTVTVG